MNDIQNVMTQYENHAKALAHANTLNKTTVFDALTALHISKVTVSFNGEGDSGQIEEVVAYIDEKPQRVPSVPIQFRQVPWGNSAETTVLEISLYEAIKTLCYDYLSAEHGGWENNDGGFGDFTFNVAEHQVHLDFSIRYTDSTNFSQTF